MINRVWILLYLLLADYAVVARDTLDIANSSLVSLYHRNIDGKIERPGKKFNKHTTGILKRGKAGKTICEGTENTAHCFPYRLRY